MSDTVSYSFCVIEAHSRDRARAVTLVAKMLAAGFALQASHYNFSLVPVGGAALAQVHMQPVQRDVAIYTLVRQTQSATAATADQALLDAHIADAIQNSHISVQIA
jgi:hypothetical protein